MGSTRICTLVLLIALLAACSPTPPDRRPQAEALAGELRVLPAVQSVRADVVDSPAQDLVAVRIGVEANGDITADQIAAVVERYLDGLSDVDYTGYRTELRVTSASSLFAVESNDPRITNGPEVVAQSRSWAGARREFPDASIHLTAAVVHPPVQFGLDGGPPAHRPPPDVGHGAFGDMELPDPADYRTLSDTVTRMAARFPDLAAGGWTFLTGTQHPAEIHTSKRLPTPAELDVWARLNADQAIRHVDALTINGIVGPVWFSEKAFSDGDALELARRHLPVVASLPAPVFYTSSQEIQGHVGWKGQVTGPLAVMVGGCIARDYPPAPAETQLIDAYQRCPR